MQVRKIKIMSAGVTLIVLAAVFFIKSRNTSSNMKTTLYDIDINTIDGKRIELSQFQGKKILFVNVASKCGFTKQYEDLQTLHEQYKDDLAIIGLPCNQFGGQEPGTELEIQAFCQRNYGVEFLISEKLDVKGEKQHPIYSWLTKKDLNGKKNSSVKWNFQKYLVDENGDLIDYYFSITSPLSKKITSKI